MRKNEAEGKREERGQVEEWEGGEGYQVNGYFKCPCLNSAVCSHVPAQFKPMIRTDLVADRACPLRQTFLTINLLLLLSSFYYIIFV